MDVASLITGGKDSIYSTYVALHHGWNIKYLVTLLPERADSWMYHSINIHLVHDIARSMGLPLVTRKSCGIPDRELEDLKEILKDLDIDGIVSGVIASDYQRERIGRVCDELGLRNLSPIWHKDQEMLLKQQLDAGFEILIDSVSAEGLGEEWLGRILDKRNLDEFLKVCREKGINPSGEGGEFETLVLDCPLYHDRMVIVDMEKIWKKDRGYCSIKKIRLEKKSVGDIPELF